MTTRHVRGDFWSRERVRADAADADEISVVLPDDQPLVLALADGDPERAAGETRPALLLVQDLDIRVIEPSPHGSSALVTTGNTANETRRSSSCQVHLVRHEAL